MLTIIESPLYAKSVLENIPAHLLKQIAKKGAELIITLLITDLNPLEPTGWVSVKNRNLISCRVNAQVIENLSAEQ